MKTQLSIQERLKDLRVEKGMTLEQLSQQTKIPASTLGSYESDDYKEIPHRNIIELAKFYEVSTDYLLGMAENFAGTSKQKLAYIFTQFLKIKPTEKNIDDMADMLGQSEILEPDAKKRRNSTKRKQSKD